jgi:hypothetical protein
MSNLSETNDQGSLRPAAGRRNFLKAAASAAPLVATLPSGAAWATSTSQCILDAIKASPTLTGAVDWPPPSADQFVRVKGETVTWEQTQYVPPPPTLKTQLTYHIPSLDNGTELYWMPDGKPFDPTDWKEKGRTDVALLQVFTPQPWTADPSKIGPTTVGPCSPGESDTKGGCIYPVSQVNTANPPNIGMQASCLCSVNPGAMPSGFCQI